MQSVQTQTLEKQIEQLFLQVVSVWRETDTKKSQAVKLLAARMEELYETVGIPIDTICQDITRRLESVGLTKTANHVRDYLESKYKQEEKQHYNFELSEGRADSGANDAKNLLVMHKDIPNIVKDEAQDFWTFAKKVEVHAKAIKQLCEINGWPLPEDDALPNKKYEKVTTELPDPKRGYAWNAIMMHVLPEAKRLHHTWDGIMSAIERIPPSDDKDEELGHALELLGRTFKGINDFCEPFKDLKFATTKPKWWRTVIRYFDHGKHAAGVMDAIDSHKYLEERELPVNAINCYHEGCPYFVTLSEAFENMQQQARPQLELLLEHTKEAHNFEPPLDEPLDETIMNLTRKVVITTQKITVQVPKERDLTREQVGDKIKELVEEAINFVPAIKSLLLLSGWREKETDGRVATRRIEANPKLSDLA